MSHGRPNQLPEWAALAKHRAELGEVHLRDLFADDPGRGEKYSLQVGDLYLDYRKHLVTDETLGLLRGPRRGARGAPSCATPCSAATRSTSPSTGRCCTSRCARPRDAVVEVDGENVVPKVHAVLDRMAAFAERVRSGEWTGFTGERIRNVVNIGIGGSDLGPAMAYEALRALHRPRPDVPLRLQRRRRRPRTRPSATSTRPTTLFIVSSKTFTTIETITNADRRPPVAPRRARRRRRGRQALRRRVDQRRRGREVRHRHDEHVRVLGLGRRPVLLRLARSACR